MCTKNSHQSSLMKTEGDKSGQRKPLKTYDFTSTSTIPWNFGAMGALQSALASWYESTGLESKITILKTE